MKVVLVSFGHADSAIPMAKALSEFVEVDLLFTFPMNRKRNNVIDFEELDVQPGMQNDAIAEKAFSTEVKKYVDGKFKMKLFIYKSLKIKSLSNLILSRKYAKILKNYDIIHFNGKNMHILPLKFFLGKKKFIYTVHDLENHSGEQAKNVLAQKFNHNILKSESHVIIQNKADYQKAKEEYHKRSDTVHFIPFGQLEIYKYYDTSGINARESDVLFFGRISPYKGIEYFIKAVHMLKKDIPNIKAVIAGSGKFYFDIREIEQDKTFTVINKFIQSDELVALIKASKIVVCPYTDATQSGVALTAFVFNKPVIATDTGGFKDVIKNGLNGYLVPAKNAEAIYEKAKLLLENRLLLEKMSENIQDEAESGDFAWSTIAQNYFEVYKKALNR
jgi:glycosyltransferase involved in cell wall biosynthesis